MLILTRYPGETVEITAEAAASITVTVMDVMSNGVVKLGFDGPGHVRFMRDNAIRRRPGPPRSANQPKEQGYEKDPRPLTPAEQQALDASIEADCLGAPGVPPGGLDPDDFGNR